MKVKFTLAISLLIFLLADSAFSQTTVPGTSRNFELVGHNSFFDRGLNAAEINGIGFLEGNSNLGDAVRLDAAPL